MATYNVTIRATVTKTITVDAPDKDKAIENAHSQFTVACELDTVEGYDEETLSCDRIT